MELLPAARIVPAGGSYVNVPCTLAVAFHWLVPSGVPKVMGAGLDQVIEGLTLPAISSPQLFRKLVAPPSTSARNNVHSPPALNPSNSFRNVVRGEVVVTTAGSTKRASGCQVP